MVTVTNDSKQIQYWGNSSVSALTELPAKETLLYYTFQFIILNIYTVN